MVKYFSYEVYLTGNNWLRKNEIVLLEKPQTSDNGYIKIRKNDSHYYCYIDIEKMCDYYGGLPTFFKKILDRLVIEQRNNKLETL